MGLFRRRRRQTAPPQEHVHGKHALGEQVHDEHVHREHVHREHVHGEHVHGEHVHGVDDAQVQEWRDGVARHGRLVLAVPPGDADEPGFHCTAGLTEHGHPELIVYGLPDDVGADVLNDLAERLLQGERWADGDVVPELVQGDYRVQLWTATDVQDPPGAAYALYGRDRVRLRQLVVPDAHDRLPWEDGYAHPDLQPLLFRAPNGVGPRRVQVPPDHAAPEVWDLPVDPHTTTITTRWVLEERMPVLLVVHEEDGEWQVLDGVHVPEVEDASLVCLHHVVDRDPTLTELVRDLPAGHRGVRDAVGGTWRVEPVMPE